MRAEETLRAAAQRMSAGGFSCLVALRAGTPCAVVTDRDLALGALCGGLEPSSPVAAVRWRPLVTVLRGERADEAIRLMERHGLRHLPVSGDGGRIVGMVAVEDALALLLEDLVELARRARAGAAPLLRAAALRAEDAEVTLPTVDGGASARALAGILARTSAETLLVVEGAAPAGLVCDRDLLALVAGRRDASLARARDLVRRPLASVDASDPLEKVVEVMASRGVDQVAVARGARIRGMVSLQGVLAGLALELAALLAHAPAPAEAGPRRRLLH